MFNPFKIRHLNLYKPLFLCWCKFECNGWNSLSEGVPSLRGLSNASAVEDVGVQKSVLPLIFGCNHFGQYYLYTSFAGQKKQKPRHTGRISRLFLCSEVALRQHSSVGGEPCRSSLSSVFRVLRNSFSYPRFVRITHTQTVLALNPKNRRPLDCDAYGAGWVLSYQCYGWNRINTADWNTRLYPFKLLPDTNIFEYIL